MRPLHHPPVAPQAPRRFNPPARNPWRDAPPPQGPASLSRIVCLIRMQLGRPLTRPPAGPLDRLHGIYSRFHHLPVWDIGRREDEGQRYPLPIDQNMTLRARFAAIRRIRPGLLAPRGAGTLAESSAARLQSIWSATPNAFNNTWWTLCQIPLACQSRSRRQHVIPLPQPISWGKYSQGMPVRSTKRMPVGAEKEITGRGLPTARLEEFL